MPLYSSLNIASLKRLLFCMLLVENMLQLTYDKFHFLCLPYYTFVHLLVQGQTKCIPNYLWASIFSNDH